MANVDIAALSEAVKQVESGGRRYDSSGKLLTSKKGAQGEMQVMPKTARDPGFGVSPARDDSPDELARVGRDYLSALVDKYGDVEHALVAYNWGPTNANKWIARGADKAKLPKETRNYLSRVDKLMGAPVEVAAQTVAQPVKAAREPRPTEQVVESDGFRGYSNSLIRALGSGFQAALAAVSLSDDDDEEGEPKVQSLENTAEGGGRARDLLQGLMYESPFGVDPSKQPELLRMAEGGDVKDVEKKLSDFERRLTEAVYGRKGQEMDPYKAEERAYRSSVENKIGFPVPDDRREARKLLDYLKSVDFMPMVRESDIAPGGRGHERPSYRFKDYGDPGTINFPVNSPAAYRAYTHELTHAADSPSRQAYAALVDAIKAGGRDLTEQEKRFVSNFEKLYVTPTKFPLQFREGELLENKRYRSDPVEMRAFGAGNMAQRMPKEGFSKLDIGAEFNPHVDATMAQEAAIMRELYRDLYKSRGRVGYADGGEVADPDAALLAGAGDVPAKPRISNEEFIRESIKGLGEYPYLAAGAPVDLATMAMRPFGYDVEKPVMGSEWIKEKATELGVRPEDTKDPRLQGPRLASEMLFSLMNPASAPRATAKALDIATDPKTKEAAKALMKEYMAAKEAQYYALPGASYAVKPKGGVWLPGGNPPHGITDGSPEYIKYIYGEELTMLRDEISPEKYEAIKKMLESGKVEKYFKNKFATGDDPVRNAMLKEEVPFETLSPSDDQADWDNWVKRLQGEDTQVRDQARIILEKLYDKRSNVFGSVVVPSRAEGAKYTPLSENAPDFFAQDTAALRKADDMIHAAAETEGQKMSLEGVPRGLQPPASTIAPVEMRLSSDSYSRYEPEGVIARLLRNEQKDIPGLDNYVPPQAFTEAAKRGEPIYAFSTRQMGFPDIKAFHPEEALSGLATLTPKQLGKMSFEDALITGLKNRYSDPLRFYKKDVDDLEEAMRKGTLSEFTPRSVKSVEELFKFGTKAVKLPEGRQTHTLDTEWVQLTDPRATYLEGEFMQHSVGGYFRNETGYGNIGEGGRKAFEKGDAVIYSLRDTKTGAPRGVTVEVDMTDPETIVIKQIKGEVNQSPVSRDKDIFELLYALEKKYAKERPDAEVYVESQSYGGHGIDWQDAYNNWRYNIDGKHQAHWIEDSAGNLQYVLDMGFGLGE